MSKTYTYQFSDFLNNIANAERLNLEIFSEADITIGLEYVTVKSNSVDIIFKTDLSSNEEDVLDALVAAHTGAALEHNDPPVMSDGRPIVRADTRPLNTATYFTMASDTVSGIGNGTELRWDFSDPENYPTLSGGHVCSCGYVVPEGYKAIIFDLFFLDPVYFKDGTIYHFDSPWGQHCYMTIIVPAGNYYPNDHGNIPASALGLSGTQMYSYAASDTPFYTYVNKHYMYGSCPMGDELNAEGCMVDALPIGWFVRGTVVTPEDDNISKGFAEYEMYRHRSVVLTGDTP